MQNLKVVPFRNLSENTATELMFDGLRRAKNKGNCHVIVRDARSAAVFIFEVETSDSDVNLFLVTLYNEDGMVVATAHMDQFDR